MSIVYIPDICVSCGNYAGESRQICIDCEVKKNV